MLDLIGNYNLELEGNFATLFTNMIALEGLAKNIDPNINILKTAIPYFKYIEKKEIEFVDFIWLLYFILRIILIIKWEIARAFLHSKTPTELLSTNNKSYFTFGTIRPPNFIVSTLIPTLMTKAKVQVWF